MARLFAPLITPFTLDQSIDFAGLEKNLILYQATSLDGFLVNGSSAEAEMLTLKEREEILTLVCREAQMSVIAGLVATSTYDALQQLENLAKLRLEAVLVRTPSYYGKQLDQVSYFRDLADASFHPIMVYQIPQYTGVRLSGEELFEIAEHPNVVGVKDSLGDLALLNEKPWPSHFQYFLGASALLQPGMSAGAAGGILALANVVPEACRRLLDLCAEPCQQAARELQRQLIPLNRLLGGSRGFGLPGLKAACEIQGFQAGLPRKPFQPLSALQREVLVGVMGELQNSLLASS